MSAPLRLVAGGRFAPHGEAVDPDLIDFDRWQRDLRGLRPNTVRSRHDVLHRVSTYIGKRLRDATEGDLLRWERDQVAGHAAETRRCYVAHVRAFYRWAVLTGIVGAAPTSRLTTPKITQGMPRPIPDEDLRRAVATARPKMRLQMLLAAFCGLRCQEVAGIHWSDLQKDGEQTVLLVREGKGGKERVVPVPQVVLDAMVGPVAPRRSGPMFYGEDAAQIDARSVSSSINRFFQRHGMNYTAHQLRHRYATTIYRLSKDIRLTQELLGHGSPTTTARYAAYDKSQTVDMVAAMDAAWRQDRDIASETVAETELEAVAGLVPPEDEGAARETPEPVRLPRGYPPPPPPIPTRIQAAGRASMPRPTTRPARGEAWQGSDDLEESV